MSFYYHPSIGTFHLQTAKPRRVVPAEQRHKWSQKLTRRGDSATCLKCGCVKTYCPDYEIRYHVPGAKLPDLTRPACTGSPTPAAT